MRVFHGLAFFVRLARFDNAILPAVALIAGAVANGRVTDSSLVLRIISLVLIHSVVTIWNDIADEPGDALNGIHRIAAVRRAGMYRSVLFLNWLSAAVGVLLLAWLPLGPALTLFAVLVVGWAYNARPFHASHRPIASIIMLALAYGLLPFLSGSGLHNLSWRLWALALCWTCIRSSLSMLKDYKDAPGDAKAGKKTFLLVYGNHLTLRLSLLFCIIGYAGCIAIAGYASRYSVLALLTLSTAAMWLLYERSRLFWHHTYEQLNNQFHTLLAYELFFDCLVVVWLSR